MPKSAARKKSLKLEKTSTKCRRMWKISELKSCYWGEKVNTIIGQTETEREDRERDERDKDGLQIDKMKDERGNYHRYTKNHQK